MKSFLLRIIPLALFLVGCASNPQDAVKESAVEAEQEQEARFAAVIDAAPSWYLEPVSQDEDGYYAVGTAVSPRMDRAIDKARLGAEYRLAKHFEQSISGLEQSFVEEQEGLSDSYMSQDTIAVSKILKNIDVSGYSVLDTETFYENGKYRHYVHIFLTRADAIAARSDASVSTKTISDRADEVFSKLELADLETNDEEDTE